MSDKDELWGIDADSAMDAIEFCLENRVFELEG